MKYAVIDTGNRQYKVGEGQEVQVEKVAGNEGEKIVMNKVLLVVDDSERRIGRPFIPGASVTGRIIAQKKEKKIRVATYKAKSRYRKVKGHRQEMTHIRVENIVTRSVPK